MKVTDGEKLILLMLGELYEKMNVQGDIDPDFIRSAIFEEQTWSIPWKYSGIPFENQDTPDIVNEVLDILDMWSFIEASYNQLTDEEKLIIEADANPFGKNPKFEGFDGNNESEYMSTASFIVNQLDRFSEFSGRSFNCHYPSLDMHHRMLSVFKPIRENISFHPLNTKEIVTILNERVHPEHRK